jgi:hypothetical protein
MNKENINLNISSTTVEKGLDLAKDFLDKLIMPSVEETGLLIKEKVTYWRFKNQVRILNKSQEYCIKNNIKPKAISLKLLCPLLENASLEEDDYLQEKWAILLGNMVDSEQNVENHVFPFLLGQMSKNELLNLEKTHFINQERSLRLAIELEEVKKLNKSEKDLIKKEISELNNTNNDFDLRKQKWKLQSKLRNLESKEERIIIDAGKVETLDERELEEFEIYNLIRLGVVTNISNHIGYTGNIEVLNRPDDEYIQIGDIDVQIEKDYDEFIMTQLGSLFVKACHSKK